MTKQNKISDALVTLGHKEVKGYNTSKYRVFKRVNSPYQFYFVGKAGALRTGKTISDSFPISPNLILREAKEQSQ